MTTHISLPDPRWLAAVGLTLWLGPAARAQDGLPDPTFGAGTGATTLAFDVGNSDHDSVNDLAVLPDGRILVAGSVSYLPSTSAAAVARFRPGGTLDPSFGTHGRLIIPPPLGEFRFAWALLVQEDGKFVVAGHQTSGAWIERRLADGDLDMSCHGAACRRVLELGNGGTAFFALALAPNGNIVAAGRSAGVHPIDMLVVQLKRDDFSYDTTFHGDGIARVAFDIAGTQRDIAFDVAVGPTGGVILGGFADLVGADQDFAVAVLHPSGAPNLAFSEDGKQIIPFDLGDTNSDVGVALLLQPDGKIVIGGRVQRAASDDVDFGLARLTQGGLLDAGFGTGGKCLVHFDLGNPGRQDHLNGLALQSDGKIVAVGTIATGNPANYLDFGFARIDPDGDWDSTFGGDGRVTVDVEPPGASGNAGNFGNAVGLHAGRPLAAGGAEKFETDTDFALVRLTGGLIFMDGLEYGFGRWSAKSP